MDAGDNALVEPRQSRWDVILNALKRFLFMYFVSQLIGKLFFRNTGNTAQLLRYSNHFSPLQTYSLLSFIVEYDTNMTLVSQPRLIWNLSSLRFNDWRQGPTVNSTFDTKIVFDVSENMIKNGSIHIISCISGKTDGHFVLDSSTIYKYCDQKSLSQYRKYKKVAKKLLIGKTENEDLAAGSLFEDGSVIPYWHEEMHINVLYDTKSYAKDEVVPPFNKYIKLDLNNQRYYPVVYLNDYWNYHQEYSPIHESNKTLRLNITFYPLSFYKWQMYLAMSMQNKVPFMELQNDPENSDQIKKLIKETNFYLLILTFTISTLHGIFEFLAFKNDIQFWRSRTTHEGLSLSSLVMGIFQTGIVFLYVLDNETNFIVITSCGVGLLIELWKVNRILKLSYRMPYENFPLILPVISLRTITSGQSETQEYDKQAIKYLSVFLFPLMVAYTVYSLLYTPHKGWYSFVLSVIYGYLLTFGFIMMTPQLFINYKLKSVAHLPWRMMTYKALNTFIDDIFAFVIKMPTLYRIGCFRDDIVFLIYLYQRWIYPTDMKRVNEFGGTGEVSDNTCSAETLKVADAEDKHEKLD